MPDDISEVAESRKIPFLEWLWLRHSDPEDHFHPLAHLILSNSLENSPWKNKPSLNPIFVLADVQALYASRRTGVTAQHVDLAREALRAYADDDTTIATLVEERRRPYESLHTTSTLTAAQQEPFREAGIHLLANSLNPRCMHVDPNTGRNCRLRSLPGDTLCSRHGGNTYTPEELRAMHKASRDKLIAATEAAVDTTIELMLTSPSDEIRRKAAEMVMDRTGLIPGQALHVTTTPTETDDRTPAEILLERLTALGQNHTPNPEPTQLTPSPTTDTFEVFNDTDEDIIEGVIIQNGEEESDVPLRE